MLRVMFSVVLLLFAIFVVVYKRSTTTPAKTDLLTPLETLSD